MAGDPDRLLTVTQAARLLGRSTRTARALARRAAEREGDPSVSRVGFTWAAPASWWEEHLPLVRIRQDPPKDQG